MNKRWKKEKKPSKPIKHSPVLFEDEEITASSSSEVKKSKISLTPQPNVQSNHSTPIHQKFKLDQTNSPDLNYNDSPIGTLTQHTPNEVGWDYHRPTIKDDNKKSSSSTDLNKTPKRSVHLSKKRNSNSPLLYKPVKKKLIQEKQQESMAGFMAELKAIEEKTKKKGEKSAEAADKVDDLESQLVIDMNSQNADDSDMRLQVSTNTDESPKSNRLLIVNKNLNVLLDDSIDEEMVLCSQEVEERVLQSERRVSSGSSRNSHPKLVSTSDPNVEAAPGNSLKENLQPDSEGKTSTEATSITSVTSREGSSLEIPHDSFDDLLVGFNDEDFCKDVNTEMEIDSVGSSVKISNKNPAISATSSTVSTMSSKSNTVQNKFFTSKSLGHNEIKKVSSGHIYSVSHTSSATVQNKIVNSNASFGYLNNDYKRSNSVLGNDPQSGANSSTNQDVRLLKSKSFSDSSFSPSKANRAVDMNQLNNGLHDSHSNSNPSACPVGSKGWRRIHSSSSIDGPNSSQRSNSSSSEYSKPISTPAEIARKRREAELRREAKLKMQLCNTAISRQQQFPIKR
ncbi:hypothetical protein QAD02_004706 [Eretmocerus hayati]|uniref:Uncharacterized protein n=1 Tax=Eretmocerus hayati TaxID=131215 RepID=A0ACC2NT24_9HYME|nr:hypothetical protein QAD02_004706 [Eretmocerus hayati]